MGATNPADATPGSIRGDLALSMPDNLVHGSDSRGVGGAGDRALVSRCRLLSRRSAIASTGTAQADEYQAVHGPQLNVDDLIWGAWSIPEAELGALGEVEGKDILELGCGAARWSIELATARRPAGRARQLCAAARAREGIDGRGGGGLPADPCVRRGDPASATPPSTSSSPITARSRGPIHTSSSRRSRACCGPAAFSPSTCRARFCACVTTRRRRATDEATPPLVLRRSGSRPRTTARPPTSSRTATGSACCARTGFSIEALFELRPPDGATTTYGDYVFPEWAAQWPGEHLWKARKA